MEKSQNIRTKSAFIPKNNLKHNFFFLYFKFINETQRGNHVHE